MKNTLLILFSLLSFLGISQNGRKVLHGKIVSDSLSVSRIHIINKTTQKGALSNQYGDFAIPVKVDDTLVFSAVQYEIYRRIVSEIDLKRLQVIINLQPRVNLLDEVVIKPISVAERLNLPNADKKPLNRVENRLNAHSSASAPVLILAALLSNKRGGINDMYYLFSGKRKRDRKLNKLMKQDKLADVNSKTKRNIRLYFKDDFFVYTVGIPAKEINDFIDYCLKDDVVALYNQNRLLELIEIFMEERVPYLQQIKD